MWGMLIVLVRIAVLVYIGMTLILAGCQRGMMYIPTRLSQSQAVSFAATDGLIPWNDLDGELIGWRLRPRPENMDVLLFFHGNAGFAGHRGYLAHGFSNRFDVHILEYPGYGSRPGNPSEQSFRLAAEQALRQLQQETNQRIFLAGESLGTGVAAWLASTYPEDVAGLFLVTPFDSLVNVARHHYPIFPVRWLLRDRFESARHLEKFNGPIAILLAENDEVVPAQFGQALYDAYAGPKRIWLQEGRSHNTLDFSPGLGWWNQVADFLKQQSE